MEAEHSKGKDPNQTKPNIRRRITRTAAVAENDDNDAFNSNNFSIQRQVLPTAKTTTTTTTTHWQFILAAFCGGDFMLLYRKNFLIVVADRLRRTEQSFSRIHNKGQQQPKKQNQFIDTNSTRQRCQPKRVGSSPGLPADGI